MCENLSELNKPFDISHENFALESIFSEKDLKRNQKLPVF